MEKMKVKIDGMSCQHCTMKVKAALESLDEIKQVKVSLKKAEALIKFEGPVNKEKMHKAVHEVGYEVV